MKKETLNSMRFSNLVVTETLWVNGRRFCKCVCDCGAEKTVAASSLKNGDTRSCGCLRSTVMREKQTKHGAYGTPAYRSYRAMLARCKDVNHKEFANYGGRGISVCDRWVAGFEFFLSDMGKRPAGTSIDRINSDGNYEPGNCRWATSEEQAKNKKVTKTITHNGLTNTITEWGKILGIPRDRISLRLKRGKSVEQALAV